MPASAATTTQICKTIDHVTWKTVKHVTYKRVHGKRVKVVRHVRVEVLSKTTTCTVTGATGATGSTGATGAGAVVPTLTPEQQVQAWANASGNRSIFLINEANDQLQTDENSTPSEETGSATNQVAYLFTPSIALQATITADANALVADAQAGLNAPPPGDLTVSWDAVINDIVAYGNQVAADPGRWGAYTFSQADVSALYQAAGNDGLPEFMSVPNPQPLTTITAPTPELLLEAAVISWGSFEAPGSAANEQFGNLSSTYHPLTGSYTIGDGTNMITEAQTALANPPPGNLAAPFIAVADDYLAVGKAIAASQAVTPSMITTLNSDVTTWNAVLAGDGTNVDSWIIASF